VNENDLTVAGQAFNLVNCNASILSVSAATNLSDSDNTHSTKLSHVHYWKHRHTCLSPNRQHSEMPTLDMSSLTVPNIVLVGRTGILLISVS
jgi:hypothetical protein